SIVPSIAIGRRASLSCRSDGTRIGSLSNTKRSGAPTMRSTIERSSNAPLELTIIQPNPASQQRSCNVARNRSLSPPSFAATKRWIPSEPDTAAPVSARDSPALVEYRDTRAVSFRVGNNVIRAPKNPPCCLSRVVTVVGMPLLSTLLKQQGGFLGALMTLLP